MKLEPRYGKHRGTVVDDNDPMGLGRLRAVVPAISPEPLGWAMPCVPYGGNRRKRLIPPPGSGVWI